VLYWILAQAGLQPPVVEMAAAPAEAAGDAEPKEKKE
jgi:hypothetical protein